MEVSSLRSEQGSILLVLLVAMVLGGIVIFEHTAASIELLIADHEHESVQTLYLAESGYEHALAVVNADPRPLDEWLVGADGAPGTPDDGRVLGLYSLPLGDGYYDVTVIDNDDDGDPTRDQGGLGFIVVTGVSESDTVSRVLAGVRTTTAAAASFQAPFLFNGDATFEGGVKAYAPENFHANGDFVFDAYGGFMGEPSASGQLKVSSDTVIDGQNLDDSALSTYVQDHSFVPETAAPQIDPEQFRDRADYVLGADGTVQDASGKILGFGDTDAWNGLQFDAASGLWYVRNVRAAKRLQATIFVDGDFNIAVSTMGSSRRPAKLSVIATGSIRVHAYTEVHLQSAADDIQFVAGGDLVMQGRVATQGHVLVSEQASITGSGMYNGAFIVGNNADEHTNWLTRGEEIAKFDGEFGFDYSGLTPPPLSSGNATTLEIISWFQERAPASATDLAKLAVQPVQ